MTFGLWSGYHPGLGKEKAAISRLVFLSACTCVFGVGMYGWRRIREQGAGRGCQPGFRLVGHPIRFSSRRDIPFLRTTFGGGEELVSTRKEKASAVLRCSIGPKKLFLHLLNLVFFLPFISWISCSYRWAGFGWDGFVLGEKGERKEETGKRGNGDTERDVVVTFG